MNRETVAFSVRTTGFSGGVPAMYLKKTTIEAVTIIKGRQTSVILL
jgi:hypothetical protein